MISLEEFHIDFIQSIYSDAESRGLVKKQSFFESVCEELLSIGELTNNYGMVEFSKPKVEVFGFDYDEERKIFTLITFQFFEGELIQTFTKKDIDAKFRKLESFLDMSMYKLYEQLEETSDSYELAFQLYDFKFKGLIDKVRFLVLTDGKITRNVTSIPSKEVLGIPCEYKLVDIEYLYTIFEAENKGGSYEVPVNIPYLLADSPSNNYVSYLGIIDGNQLFDIYDEYGQKLLEQNVRTFLQFRGKVNKGLKNTIQYSPEMFFAYNNGITATATNVETKNGHITKITDFQIVNGGQTTSAIYAAKKNSRLDLSKISVQMKLSVVRDLEKTSEFVSKVSEYANTQNKVNKSDFFSNSPFHKEMKEYSQKIWVSAKEGMQKRTHWFYERVRGEYLNEQAYLTDAKKKAFQLENPKSQVIDKTFLAKSENSWNQKPDIVSKGSQYSFEKFANTVTEMLDKEQLAITEKYFKDSISRIILFKSTERIVSKASWYENAFRAQTVTYSIALLAHNIMKKKIYFDFSKIWALQNIPAPLLTLMEEITFKVYKRITNPPTGSANIAQWCKKEACWKDVQKLDVDLKKIINLLKNADDEWYEKKTTRREKTIETGIEIQTFIVETPLEVWNQLYGYFLETQAKLTTTQNDILKKYVSGYLAFPSERQSKVLFNLYKKAEKEGWKSITRC